MIRLSDVIAGSTLDLEISFLKFHSEVVPASVSYSLIGQSSTDLSSWSEISSGVIEPASVMTLSIPGSYLGVIPSMSLNRSIIFDWEESSSPYHEVVSFQIQPLPSVTP